MRTLALTSHLSIHTKTLNQEAHVQSLKRPEFCSNIFIQLLKDNFKYTKRTQGQILQSCPMRLPVHEQHGYLVVRVQSHPERLRAAHMCQHDACTKHWRASQPHLSRKRGGLFIRGIHFIDYRAAHLCLRDACTERWRASQPHPYSRAGMRYTVYSHHRTAHMCQHDACTEHWRARQSHLYSQDSYPTHSCICIKLRTLKGSPAAPI
jgi:hypothetical protein